MKLIIAGTEKQVENNITISKLIELENVETPQYVTVSVNDEFVSSESFDTQTLNDGDAIEFLYFMGGGQ